MARRSFMLLMAWFHMVFGVFFFFGRSYASRIIFSEPGEYGSVMMIGLSGIVFSFGLLNYLARNSADSPALGAVLIGTAFYLLFTIAFDSYWTMCGLLNPIAWASIGIRAFMAWCYVYYLIAKRKREVTSRSLLP